MKRSYQVAVIGCGGIGSAAAYWLSRQAGADVLALEQFPIGHHNGGSQDHSRIIRYSYHDPIYVDLAMGAYASWETVEEESGIQLVVKTGGLDLELVGPVWQKDVNHIADALEAQNIAHERLNGAEIRYRWPQFTVPDSVQAVYQADGGLVDAGKSIAVHIALARARGATVLDETLVRVIRPVGDRIEIVTDDGVFDADHVVIASGAWTNKLLGDVGVSWPLTVTQEQVTYFATPNLRDFAPDRFPIWLWRGREEFYGFPVYGEVATKAGQDVAGSDVTADTRTFEPDSERTLQLERFLAEYIPGFLGPELYTKTCLYTLTPDRYFVLGSLPQVPQISVAVGAGHAMKFAGILGKLLSELALEQIPSHDLSPYRPDRSALTDSTFRPQFRNEDLFVQT